ncbi:TetR family transcriptional regulator [Catenovulum agarivorans DS-2]|uniref:TetR family transcriptional regulator n=1 Tax=Catenovulum agarivorans DS-2 TaxID=1328313 RepID=W7QFZ8_9ALTE|nr:hypothetical protein [Catenovulum agarivorans]EWH10821.1 TetR family transcriptional regulator [Catenovulum agarivorans DS-2]
MTTEITARQFGIDDAGAMDLNEFEHAVISAALSLLDKLPAEDITIRKLSQALNCAPSTLLARYKNYQNCWQFVAQKLFDYWFENKMVWLDSLDAVLERLFAFSQHQPYVWRLLFDFAPDQQAHLIDHSHRRQQQLVSLIQKFIQQPEQGMTAYYCLFAFCHLQARGRLVESIDGVAQQSILRQQLMQMTQQDNKDTE